MLVLIRLEVRWKPDPTSKDVQVRCHISILVANAPVSSDERMILAFDALVIATPDESRAETNRVSTVVVDSWRCRLLDQKLEG